MKSSPQPDRSRMFLALRWPAAFKGAKRLECGSLLPLSARAKAPASRTHSTRSAHAAARTEGGVALVVTLILLALITTLAIAFLGITHRETGAVDSMARTTDAEEACESALERAKAQIIAPF